MLSEMKTLLFLLLVSGTLSLTPSRLLTISTRKSYLQSAVFNENDSERLKKARLRLAEAQGIIPIGASEMSLASIKDLKAIPSQSKVREISWRVAEPEVTYNPSGLSAKLFSQPIVWLGRNIQIFAPLTFFFGRVLTDILLNKEEENRPLRAAQILDIVSQQSPALIKAGQALSSRSDLLPKEYLDSLQQLQDRCPPFPTEDAFAVFESELGVPFEDVFELEGVSPVATASIGQVYKGVLKRNGAKVAIKVQRPNCEASIAIDLFILRWYAQRIQQILSLLKRDIDLVAVIDDFGELIYREIDYRAEAVNAQRFAELYSTLPDVFVPKVYTDLSTSKVLVMEWVDGARLNDKERIQAMGLDSSRMLDVLVQCSLRQLLENGFFHADPHAGNLLAMENGQLCYLDFGMVSYVETPQRLSIIEAVVHMVNRDFNALAELYRRMGFIPDDVDITPIVIALENALPDVLNSAVGDFNFKKVIAKLGDVMYKFPFSLPPFYIAIIRCLGVLEGLAIQIDNNFRIVKDAYPYIASRLLTDSSEELQSALQQLLFKEGEVRWDRLQELLEEAAEISDYDVSLALDQMLNYLVSEQGRPIREILATQIVEVSDKLETETVTLLLQIVRDGDLPFTLFNAVRRGRNEKTPALTQVLEAIEERADPESPLIPFAKILRIMQNSQGLSRETITSLLRKVLREPVMQELLSRVVSQLSERLSVKFVRRIFGQPVSANAAIVNPRLK